ncbi:hypothetical protein Droror1_Dr00006360 [Drosera rotundifolia]
MDCIDKVLKRMFYIIAHKVSFRITWDTSRNNRSIVPTAAPNLANSHVTTATLNLATEGLRLVERLPYFTPAISTLATLPTRHTSPGAATASSTRAPAAAASASIGAPATYHTSPAVGAAQEVRWVPPPEQVAQAAQVNWNLQIIGKEGRRLIRRM